MAYKIYIVWCKLNKNTQKFDAGIYTEQTTADEIVNKIAENCNYYSVWVSEYTLSKVYKEKH